jgi:hypothetical protein
VGVAKEENEGMEMDLAARAEEKRDSTEEMRREICFSLVLRVVFEEVKEGVGVVAAELEVEKVEDSVDESDEEEEEEDDEEIAEELVVETKELVGSVDEVVRDEEVLSWPAEDELARLENELEGVWVEETTELLKADEDKEIAEELEEDTAAEEVERIEELDDTAEDERAWDAEDDEGRLELAFDDTEGLWTLNWEAIEASLEESLDSTLEILDWTLEAFAGIWIVVGTAFEEEELAFDDDVEKLGFNDDDEDLWAVAWEATEANLEETFDSTLEILDWMLEIFAGILLVAGTAFTDEDEVFLAELVDEVLTDEDDLLELLLEEVVFALDLLEEEDFFDMEEVAKNSGRTMIAPPTRVVGATKRAGARSTRLTSTVLMLRGAATAALARRETRATWLMGVSKRMIGDIRG